MKKYLLALVLPLVAAAALSSCAMPETPDASILRVSPETIQLGASTETVFRKITVEATDAWEIASKPEWIATRDVTETGFYIDAEPYIDGEDPSRQGVIVVEMGDQQREITVTQLVYMIPIVLTVDPEDIHEALTDVEYEISVTASHAYQADTEYNWIHIGDKTDTGFVITVDPYDETLTEDSRTGTVTVSMKEVKKTITVIQPRPLPDATPVTAYLGEYTVTGESKNIGYGGGGSASLYEIAAEMVLRPDIESNVVSIKILGDDEEPLCFRYDPITGVLRSYNYYSRPDPYFRGCAFAFFTEAKVNFTMINTYIPVPDGEFTFTLDENGEIAFPAVAEMDPFPAWEVAGGEKPVWVLDFYHKSGTTYSNIAITNVKMVKK